jgi:hypothetical protein
MLAVSGARALVPITDGIRSMITYQLKCMGPSIYKAGVDTSDVTALTTALNLQVDLSTRSCHTKATPPVQMLQWQAPARGGMHSPQCMSSQQLLLSPTNRSQLTDRAAAPFAHST